jgi:hypothetical protein
VRTSKTLDGITTQYVLDLAATLPVVISDTDAVYLYGLDIIAQQQEEMLYYMHDGLGSVRQLLDATGDVQASYAYDPFGVPVVEGDESNPYQYTGEARFCGAYRGIPLRCTVPMHLGLLILLLLCSLAAGCRTEKHFFDVTGELHVPSAAEHYAEAMRRAIEWEADAYLFSVTADVGSASGAPPSGGDLAYYFQSIATQTSFLTLRLIDGAWTAEVIPKSSAESYPAIARDEWVLDSTDAWSIALANGGEEFLVEHQEPLTSMAARLRHRTVGDQQLLVWEADFLILFGPRLLLAIDPTTGEILEVKTR